MKRTLFFLGLIPALLAGDDFVNPSGPDHMLNYENTEILEMSQEMNDPNVGYFVDGKTGKIIGTTADGMEPKPVPKSPMAKKPVQPASQKPAAQQARTDTKPGKGSMIMRGHKFLEPYQMEEETIPLLREGW